MIPCSTIREKASMGRSTRVSGGQRAAISGARPRKEHGEGAPELWQERSHLCGPSKGRRSPPLWASECGCAGSSASAPKLGGTTDSICSP